MPEIILTPALQPAGGGTTPPLACGSGSEAYLVLGDRTRSADGSGAVKGSISAVGRDSCNGNYTYSVFYQLSELKDQSVPLTSDEVSEIVCGGGSLLVSRGWTPSFSLTLRNVNFADMTYAGNAVAVGGTVSVGTVSAGEVITVGNRTDPTDSFEVVWVFQGAAVWPRSRTSEVRINLPAYVDQGNLETLIVVPDIRSSSAEAAIARL